MEKKPARFLQSPGTLQEEDFPQYPSDEYIASNKLDASKAGALSDMIAKMRMPAYEAGTPASVSKSLEDSAFSKEKAIADIDLERRRELSAEERAYEERQAAGEAIGKAASAAMGAYASGKRQERALKVAAEGQMGRAAMEGRRGAAADQ